MPQVSKKAIEVIKLWESFEPEAYLCQAKVWTIGYGSTRGVKPGDTITLEAATKLLENEVKLYEACVQMYVKVPLTENEYAALVSFTFNLGCGALKASTLLKKLNAGDKLGAAQEFLKWNKVKKNGALVVSKGLSNRREYESKLFLTPIKKG